MYTTQIKPDRDQALTYIEIPLRNFGGAILGTAQARQFRRYVASITHEQFAADIEQAALTPDCRRYLFGNRDVQSRWPAARHGCLIDPGQRHDSLLDVAEIGADEAVLEFGRYGLFNLQRRDAQKRSVYLDRPNGPIQHACAEEIGRKDHTDGYKRRYQVRHTDSRHPEPGRFLWLLAPCLPTRH